MTIPLLHLPLDGSLAGRDRNGVLTAVGAGALRYRNGKWSGVLAALIEEATTNLVRNPRFSVDTSDWGGYGSGTGVTANFARVAGGGWGGFDRLRASGSVSAGIVGSTLTTRITGADMPVTAGLAYTVSCYAQREDNQSKFRLEIIWRDAANAIIQSDFSDLASPPVGEWQRLTFTTTAPANATTAKIVVRSMQNLGGTYTFAYSMTAVQFEQKAYATSYADGSLGAGYAWTGVAHASGSTRAASSISVAHAAVPGSLVFRYRERGSTVWQEGYLTAPGSFATHHSIAQSGGNLVLSTARGVTIAPLMTFDRALTASERSKLFNASRPWTWGMLLPQLGGILRIGGSEPLGILRVGGSGTP